ncbi:MAG TPA: AAA family ATPase [Galbitalea sp.]|jgi:predicted ATPase|nr:AAA family ATPase [Galbitalea sp.]
MSHDDERRRLAAKYKPSRRFSNFGPILERMTISGFRGVASLVLDIHSPVIALSGLNGTGKSTIAQLVACGYRAIPDVSVRSYVVDFFPVSVVDPQPFENEARVVYEYSADPTPQQVTVSRATKEWSGYKRQPERATYYVGLMQFLPKVERKDFSVYGGSRLELGASTPVLDKTRSSLQSILGLHYDEADFTRVILRHRTADLAMVRRGGVRYSENHMGFGEGRMFYLVNLLETAPLRSLFVIEEPETSLHGDAQGRLSRYFVEVANRRGHQIILTTHSSAILEELSHESKVYLRREPNGVVTATTGLSTYQVDSYLHENGRSTVAICVEDEFAKTLVTEVLRKEDADLLSGVRFMPVGDVNTLPGAVALLQQAGMRALAISDTDMNHDGTDNVMSLPGSLSPEEEVFGSVAVRDYFAAAPYRLDIEGRLSGVADHHDYAESIAEALSVAEPSIVTEATRAYVEGMPEGHFDEVIQFVRAVLTDHR